MMTVRRAGVEDAGGCAALALADRRSCSDVESDIA